MAMQIRKDASYGVSTEINGNYDVSKTSHAERMKEKQAAERAEKAKEAGKETEIKTSKKLSEPRDEYISSEKSDKKSAGLYRIGQDENGSRKIFFDDPKASRAAGKEEQTGGNPSGKPAEKCVTNTDQVDQEIKKLKEKKQQLERQIQSVSGNNKEIPSGHPFMPSGNNKETPSGHPFVPSGDNKVTPSGHPFMPSGNNKVTIRELERKLAQVENELRQKDNDAYRRQNAFVSE